MTEPVDYRKQQTSILKAEKHLAAAAAAIASLGAAAKAAESPIARTQYEAVRDEMITLAETMQKSHDVLQAHATAVGAKLLPTVNGVPKSPPAEMVKSLFGF